MSVSKDSLVEIRCPKQNYIEKYKKTLVCNWLCVRVSPGSSGEAFCIQCKRRTGDGTFLFEISEDYEPPVIERNQIKVKKV